MPVEEPRQRPRPRVRLEAVLLLDRHPRQLPPPPSELVAVAGQLLLTVEQLPTSRNPLLARSHRVPRHCTCLLRRSQGCLAEGAGLYPYDERHCANSTPRPEPPPHASRHRRGPGERDVVTEHVRQLGRRPMASAVPRSVVGAALAQPIDADVAAFAQKLQLRECPALTHGARRRAGARVRSAASRRNQLRRDARSSARKRG
jgi:hypothetical protein